MSIVYKIRRSDGLFSKGGSTPSFSKLGKIWKQKGHLTSHLNQLHNDNGRYNQHCPHVYSDCEIVCYELVETPVGDPITIGRYLQEIADRKQEREDARIAAREKREANSRYAAYLALKDEFE